MIFFNLNTVKFARDYLGRLFLHPKQYALMKAYLTPIAEYMSEYDVWRKNRFYLVNITGQVFSLEGYLNDLFDNVNRTIFITDGNSNDSGVFISLLNEAIPSLNVGMSNELPSIGVYISLGSESGYSVGFTVHIPVSIVGQTDQIKGAVNQYKLAGKTYNIVTF